MGSVVSIQVRVDDNNASATLSSIENALKRVGVEGEASMRKVGQAASAAVPGLRYSMQEVTKAAGAAAPALRYSMQQVEQHSTTALDRVRLLSQEFGLRLPRAMESAISRMPALMNGINALGGSLLAFGAAEVFVRMGVGIYDATVKYFSLNDAANKFYETLKKTSELDFSNTRSIETTRGRLDQATQNMVAEPALAKTMQHTGFGDILSNPQQAIAFLLTAKKVADAGATSADQMITLTKQQLDQQHEATLAQIEQNHALDGTLQRRQQISAEQAKAREIAAANREYSGRVEKNYGNLTPGNAGEAEESQKNAAAQSAAAAKTIELNSEVSAAIIKARNAASEAGLQGEALYAQKQKDAIAEVIAELNAQHLAEEIPARVQAINKQYDADRLARLRTLTEETQRMVDETQKAGLTGAARIIADHNADLAAVDDRKTKASGGAALSPEQLKQFAAQRATIMDRSNKQILALQDTFSDSVKGIEDRTTEARLNAFARIDAAARKQKDDVEKDFKNKFGDAPMSEDQAITQADAKQRALNAIDVAASQEKSQLAQRNATEDLKFDQDATAAEARVRHQGLLQWGNDYREAVANIQAQETARIAALADDAQKEGLSDEEVARRKVDIQRQANAEIQQQQQQVQHQIASNLQQAFTNPIDFIKSKMEQMFFEIIAGWIMRLDLFKTLFGSTMGGLTPGAAGGGATAGSPIAGALSHAMGIGVPTGSTGWGGGASSTAGYGGSLGGGAGGASTTIDPAAVSSVTGMGTGSSTLSQVPSFAQEALSSAQRFGLRVPGSSSLPGGITGSQGGFGGANAPSFDDGGLGPEQQASADTYQAASTPAASGASAAMGVAGAAFGAYTGGKTAYESFFQSGAKGALDGTMGGAEAGASIGMLAGPVGALIGAGIGAAAGLSTNLVGQISGEAGRLQARDYYRKTLHPQLDAVLKGFDTSGGNYMDAMTQANRIASDGSEEMYHKYGPAARDWVKANYLNKEVAKVDGEIMLKARSGSQYTGMATTQFHTGGTIRSFGDMGTSSTEGFIHAMLGEGVVNVHAMQAHAPMVSAMNGGADAATLAGMYLNAAGANGSSSATTVHNHQHNYSAIDAKSFGKFLDTGGMKVIQNSANKRAALYAGDSASG